MRGLDGDKGSFVSFDHGVMAVNSYGHMIVRDGKSENLTVQLFFAFHRFKKFDKSFDGDGHAVRVLAIGDVESGGAAFYLAGAKREVHPRCSHEIGGNFGSPVVHL